MSATIERPTPETDAELTRLKEFDFAGVRMEGNFVSSFFARKLERERDEEREVNAIIQSREAKLVLSKDLIKRAEAIRCELVKKEKQLEAMRSAIKDAHGALDALATFHRHSLTWKTLNINDALTKLQPFLKQ